MDLQEQIRRVENDKKRREADTKIYYLDRMVEEMKRGYFCIFAGAGLSASSGYVDWKTLLEPMGKQLGLNLNMDLTLLAQYYENEFTRDELNRRILEEFAKIPRSNANMEILAQMPISRYWTTNYDSVIEDTLRKHDKIVDVIIDQIQLKYHSPERDAVVFKMHGDKTLPDSAVLCKNDYETYDENRGLFTSSLMLDMISNTFLFIGFSFSDPNLDRIIALIKKNYKGASPKKHYCFLRNINLADYLKNDDIRENEIEQFEQDSNAQECKIRDMRRYGIETILVDDYNQITQMLQYMQDKFNLNTIFISGGTKANKPDDYGNFQKEKQEGLGRAEQFIMQLADELIIKRYTLVTGFGVGVGNYIVAGAYKQSAEKADIKIEERVYIQPMILMDDDSQDMKLQIREKLLNKCGIVITLFGKSDEKSEIKNIENEDGTYIEYSISKQSGKVIIPVGATGFTSKIIYEKERKEWKDNDELYDKLGNAEIDNDELIKSIMDGIEYKKRECEENMKKLLIKIFELTEEEQKKIFVSFHYSSAAKYVNEISNVISKSNKYWMIKELQKCEENKIQEWIDNKLKDAVAMIVIFNTQFSDSRWAEYEVDTGIRKQMPFLFLINEGEDVDELVNEYIQQKEIKRYLKFSWQHLTDFKKIPFCLDSLLSNR